MGSGRISRLAGRGNEGGPSLGHIIATIRVMRGQKVILDADLAALYGTTTKRLNEQVKRNIARFPADFMFRLGPEEAEEVNRSQFATGPMRHRDPRFPPFAFTERRTEALAFKQDAHAANTRAQLKQVFEAIRELMTPPSPGKKRAIGFVTDELGKPRG